MGKLVSVIIPVYNEEKILRDSVTRLFNDLKKIDFDFELILAENGSTDRTFELGRELSEEFENMQIFQYPEPDYGKALKHGIEKAEGEYIICDEIDLCLFEFYEKALRLLENDSAEMIIGSKTLSESTDDRPLGRRFATSMLNFLLRILLGFRGSDTHGLKAFRKDRVIPVVKKCLTGKDIFASELVIRVERSRNIRIKEIPVALREKRPPSIRLFRRVPRVFVNLMYLFWVIRVKRDL